MESSIFREMADYETTIIPVPCLVNFGLAG
jgi:hypothetical protein